MFMLMSWLNRTFWRFIYPLGTSLLYNLIAFLPTGTRVSRWRRERIASQNKILPRPKQKITLLFVCPSLGEYESVKALINEISQIESRPFIEIAFFSLSGYYPLKDSHEHMADSITLLPADTKAAVSDFFKERHPTQVILSTLSIWPTFLTHLIDHSIPYTYVSVRTKHGFVKNIYYHMMLNFIRKADKIFTIDQASYDLISNLVGPKNLQLAGDPRIQSINISKASSDIKDRLEEFAQGQSIIVFGSTHEKDEFLLLPIVSKLVEQDWKVIIAPHEPGKNDSIILSYPEALLWSDTSSKSDAYILILDQIGILKHCYPYSSLTYVGGGFDRSLHNILEPLSYDNVLIVGPQIGQSLDATILKDMQAIHIIESKNDFLAVIKKCKNEDYVRQIVAKTSDYIKQKPNATKIIFKELTF